eukprot:scaffold303137_cov31-Tisochrysis_lutea.AAC.1
MTLSAEQRQQRALDSLDITKKLRTAGISDSQAEILSRCILDAIVAQEKKAKGEFSSKSDVALIALQQESRFEQSKTVLLATLDGHQAALRTEVEQLRSEIDKMRVELRHEREKTKADLRYEIDKINSSMRLDLNLFQGRMRDDGAKLIDRMTEHDVKLDREVNAINTLLAKEKGEMLRYAVATMAAFGSLGLAAVRLML